VICRSHVPNSALAYILLFSTYVHAQSTGYVTSTVLTSTELIASKCGSTLRFFFFTLSVLDRPVLTATGIHA
jgi:hypothetical protein